MGHSPYPASLRPEPASGDDGHFVMGRASLGMGHAMTRFGVLIGTLAALALGRNLAAQQQRQARDGFWFGAALGSGWARVSCQICQGNNRSGLSGTLRLGGGVSRKVLIGAEVAA